MASQKPRAQGAGRKPNSEPKQQVFKEFQGCNFELSPRDFSLGSSNIEQSDLQMNFVVVQNNASIASNKTIETRNNIVKLIDAPSGIKFTGVDFIHNGYIYLARDDQAIEEVGLDKVIVPPATEPVYPVRTVGLFGPNHTAASGNHNWTSIGWAAGELVGLTQENRLWHGSAVDLHYENKIVKPVHIPKDPNATSTITDIFAMGSLAISDTYDADDYPNRVSVKWTYIGELGSTECCTPVTFYANKPVTEWDANAYVRIGGFIPTSDGTVNAVMANVKAVEFFYTVDNSSEFIPAGRSEMIDNDINPPNTFAGMMGYGDNTIYYAGSWYFDWYGYLNAASTWPEMNLIAPTENLTQGVKAKRMAYIDGRAYFWGSSDPDRLWIGGNPGNTLNVASGVGGGWVDVDPGAGKSIRIVTKYKTQSGASIITLLCDSANSMREERYNLVENEVQLSQEQSMKAWQAEHVAGSVGCKSFKGGLVCEDGIYAVSRYGLALTTMTMEYNAQIRTNYVSDPIKPCFTDKLRTLLRNAILIEADGVLYLAFGNGDDTVDNVLFCYDIDNKAWWSYSLNVDKPILDLIHIDYQNHREGIGIVTEDALYLLPLTQDDAPTDAADFNVTIQTGELATTQPQQNWQYLSQLEFRFDYFMGDLDIELVGIDQFGRKVKTLKHISHNDVDDDDNPIAVYDLAEYMRVDLRLQSYHIRITGQARFRLTHFIAKLYTMSAKQGLVWGFDDRQTFRTSGDIHPTFKCYNDIRQAIIP